MQRIIGLFESLSPFDLSFLEEEKSSFKTALETLSSSFADFKESVSDYYGKTPQIFTKEFLDYTIGRTSLMGWLCNFDLTHVDGPNPIVYLDINFVKLAIAATKGMSFAILLTVVNAAIRPLFTEYFPKEWRLSKLVLETTVTLTFVAVPIYLCSPLIGFTTSELIQMIITSALTRLYMGYQFDAEAEGRVLESKQNSYEMRATPWIAFYTSFSF